MEIEKDILEGLPVRQTEKQEEDLPKIAHQIILGWGLSFTLSTGNYGTGGGASRSVGASGGTGGYNSTYVNVEEFKTYTIIVGAGRKWRNRR